MFDPKDKRVIEAEEFVLKDADGKISARLGTMPGEGPFLELCDAAGRFSADVDRWP